MNIHPLLTKGTAVREWYELAVRMEQVKRELWNAFGHARGAPLQRRKR